MYFDGKKIFIYQKISLLLNRFKYFVYFLLDFIRTIETIKRNILYQLIFSLIIFITFFFALDSIDKSLINYF